VYVEATDADVNLDFLLEHICPSALSQHPSGALVKCRKFIVLEGMGTSETVGAFRNSLSNARAAILGRVFYRKVGDEYIPIQQLVPESGTFFSELERFEVALRQYLPSSAPIALESFPGLYVGRKRLNYAQALATYKSVGFQKHHAHIRMFLKYEKDVRSLKRNRIPRVISPAGFVYLLLTGCYIKSVEEKIYTAVNEIFGYKVVAKGVNYLQLGSMISDAWLSYSNACSIDLDVSKLDQSICAEALHWVHTIIGACFSGHERDEIMSYLKYQLLSIVKGRFDDGRINYVVSGTLTSGQMNTSLTGVLIVCGIIYNLSMDMNMKLINCGDDCALIGEKQKMMGVRKKLHDRFGKFGMVVELGKYNYQMEQIEFCQTHILNDGVSYRAVRNVLAVLTKDSVCLDNITRPHKLAAWAKSVGEGGLASFGQIPVLQNFYRSLITSYNKFLEEVKLTNRQRKRMRRYESKVSHSTSLWGEQLGFKFGKVSDHVRMSFEIAFGISSVNQLLLEDYYDNLIVSFSEPNACDVLSTNLSLLLN
jgi:hypothetical protein